MGERPSSRKKAPERDRTPDRVLGDVLRAVRLEKGMTQEQLAWETGVERAFISELERGVKGASVNMLFRLAKGLNTSASDIIEKVEQDIRHQ